ncbi:hypothetical protein K490DRAFT_70797 [Saccharata proteae CBS 121410]|uniref:HECT-type E3 ubiquitin transferase n=1 Tax=Saccharata proteae CBS 121410 TaxID=1314787 RepID=A0A9P4M0C1_9PEZI|nr:hypothetical protein K490DRAFT_70797 [Saccharata proteae CBS 121410]
MGQSVIESIIHFHDLGSGTSGYGSDLSRGTIPAFMEILRTLVLKNWDGGHEVKRWNVIGAALEMMEDLHDDPNTRHLLSFPFIFRDEDIVSYFRAINFAAMSRCFSSAGNNYHLQAKFRNHFVDRRWAGYLDQHYSVASSRYLVLDIRRSHVLEDTLDQLWGLEKRQLLRPLKVRMGADEGERGVDQGGVTQEFFKVALAEAFNPDNGMFTLDPTTRMAWFQPLSVAPLSHFQLIGLLFSLALYNGVTLPVTFPLALYAHLLSLPCTDIADGWPEIARSFDYILSSTEDIAETLSCGYEFAFEARGQTFHINMQHDQVHLPSPQTIFDYNEEVWATGHPIVWPIPLRKEDEAGFVTNENRDQYVKDYTHWLTYESVAPQLDAFAEGFATCVPAPSLSILSPTLLRSIIEGTTVIDTHALERVTCYEAGYHAKHPFIKTFWKLVHSYSNEEKRRLLEFVTASDRVPVQGIEKVAFWVQRNGPDEECLPTSSTCFGRLLLPEYKGEGKLRRKLGIALENSRGFGSA